MNASIFGTAPPPVSTTGSAPVGLGGNQRSTFGAASSLGGPQLHSPTDINPKDGEVPAPIISEFEVLKKTMKENNRLAEEFRVHSNTGNNEILKVDDEINSVRMLLFQQKSAVQKFRIKTRALLEKVKIDFRMCEQAHQRSENMGKNPRHGHQQAIQYMHGIVDQYEKSLLGSKEMLAKLEQVIISILERDESAIQITQKELMEHLERFDKIFRAVTIQVYTTDSQVQELKDMFLEQRQRLSRFAPNPFEKRKDTIITQGPYDSIKGIDPFPSQTALMELSDYLPKTSIPTTAMPTFGSGTAASSLFAPRPTATAFSFSQPTTASSLFAKPPFGTTTTTTASSLFPSSTSLLGNVSATPAAATNTATSSMPTFGSTYSSSASGTLFSGSASNVPTNTMPTFGSGTGASLVAPNPTTNAPPSTMPAFGSTLNSSASGTIFGGPASSVPTTTMPLFGSGTTAPPLTASNPATTPYAFPQATTASSLYAKPFGTNTTTAASSLFPSSTSLLGGASTFPATSTITAPATMPTFGSTLSSSASGTLFGGSASKPLFGK